MNAQKMEAKRYMHELDSEKGLNTSMESKASRQTKSKATVLNWKIILLLSVLLLIAGYYFRKRLFNR
ncbi:hypothetical protein QWY86_17465 [Pedobacter aquatilis]|uniref:hypothetical protein n=1 Tax=Pedobacter aquatilis TaxID=351343 RepID=UPI0025B38710|nr:hypothetical protein [Pedobacter aquatilis]MDN3588476.1 hypothetical protein [Pedobacter aquatilis]